MIIFTVLFSFSCVERIVKVTLFADQTEANDLDEEQLQQLYDKEQLFYVSQAAVAALLTI